MSRNTRICGIHLGSVGVLAVIFYLIDKSLAALDGYVPGEDYPVYSEVPDGLSFTCDDKIPGYYADPETMCQVWHWCVPSIGGNIKYSFLCGPGTVFNQRTRVCDWFFKTDCPNAAAFYGINEDLYKDEQGNYINGKNRASYNPIHDDRRLTARRKRQEMAKANKHKKRQTNRQARYKKPETTTNNTNLSSSSSSISNTTSDVTTTVSPSTTTTLSSIKTSSISSVNFRTKYVTRSIEWGV